MRDERDEWIMEELSRLRRVARGLPRTEEALADALFTVFNALGDDRRAARRRFADHDLPRDDW